MDNMSYKTCPLKRATGEDLLVFQNVDMTEETRKAITEEMQKGVQIALYVKTDNGPGYAGPAIGHCDREQCGWWDVGGACCSIVTIAKGWHFKKESPSPSYPP